MVCWCWCCGFFWVCWVCFVCWSCGVGLVWVLVGLWLVVCLVVCGGSCAFFCVGLVVVGLWLGLVVFCGGLGCVGWCWFGWLGVVVCSLVSVGLSFVCCGAFGVLVFVVVWCLALVVFLLGFVGVVVVSVVVFGPVVVVVVVVCLCCGVVLSVVVCCCFGRVLLGFWCCCVGGGSGGVEVGENEIDSCAKCDGTGLVYEERNDHEFCDRYRDWEIGRAHV